MLQISLRYSQQTVFHPRVSDLLVPMDEKVSGERVSDERVGNERMGNERTDDEIGSKKRQFIHFYTG